MKTPKMLPWLARKAGISDTRAEALWAEAIVCATERTGWVGTSEYWKVAADRLIELIELESRAVSNIPIERNSAKPVAPCVPSQIDERNHRKAA
jgi:hypothetical protein